MNRHTLKRYIPHLQYHEFPRCGHDPEIEKYAKDDFFAVMSSWLKEHCSKTNGAQRIRIDRESEAIHDLILWLDEPAGI